MEIFTTIFEDDKTFWTALMIRKIAIRLRDLLGIKFALIWLNDCIKKFRI